MANVTVTAFSDQSVLGTHNPEEW